jgi:hypothetical protein
MEGRCETGMKETIHKGHVGAQKKEEKGPKSQAEFLCTAQISPY